MASDGFFFDVEKWFGSISAQRMSFAEKGVYLTMMFQQWRDRAKSLPDDPRAVADLIAVTDSQIEEVVAAWPSVRPKFIAVERSPGRIQNPVVEKTRRKQAENRRKHSEAGRQGGKASAAKRKEQRELDSKHRLSDAQANPTDKSRLDMSRSDQSRSDLSGSFVQPPTDRRVAQSPVEHDRRTVHTGKLPPLAGYRQIKVWASFIDRWLERLNGIEYDFDAWLCRIDGTLTGVLPANGAGWFELLNGLFESELRRLGVASAAADTPATPTNKRIVGLMTGGQAFLERNRRQG